MRVLLIGAGTLLMGYAVTGALGDPDVDVAGVALFLAAVLVLHDAVLLPLVIAAGVPARRWTPGPRMAGVVSLAVLVVGLPPALGGRPPDNPSVLPLPYGRNLLLVLAAIWLVALLPGAVRHIRKGSESIPAGTPRARPE